VSGGDGDGNGAAGEQKWAGGFQYLYCSDSGKL
jgi:hypothetical protein